MKADKAIENQIRAFYWSGVRKEGITILSFSARNFASNLKYISVFKKLLKFFFVVLERAEFDSLRRPITKKQIIMKVDNSKISKAAFLEICFV